MLELDELVELEEVPDDDELLFWPEELLEVDGLLLELDVDGLLLELEVLLEVDGRPELEELLDVKGRLLELDELVDGTELLLELDSKRRLLELEELKLGTLLLLELEGRVPELEELVPEQVHFPTQQHGEPQAGG